MKHFLLLAVLASAPAHAATITETWSGAGPNACHGRCTLEWAEDQLTDDERAQLEAVRARHPDPEYIPVPNGTVFSFMSYFQDAPVGYRTTTLAVLDHVEDSWGWQMDGWSFVKLTACGNWSIIRSNVAQPVRYAGATPSQPSSAAILTGFPVLPPITVGPNPWTPVVIEKPPVVEPPAPVPVPAAAWMLLTGLLGLGAFKRWA